MRKFFILCLLSVLLICLVACSKEPDYMSEILEVNTLEYATESKETGANHVNVISSTPVRTQEKNAAVSKELKLCSKTYALTYKETLFFPDRSKKVHSYAPLNNSESLVLFEEDGSIYGISNFPIAKLNITNTDSYEIVRVALENELSDWIDFSKYQHVDMENSNQNGYYSFYRFVYYNTYQGYVSDYLTILVNNDGTISALCILDDLLAFKLDFEINKDSEEKVLNAKLENMFNTDDLEFKSYEMISTPVIVVYEGELYVEYGVSCNAYSKKYSSDYGEAVRLLVPVSLLTNR